MRSRPYFASLLAACFTLAAALAGAGADDPGDDGKGWINLTASGNLDAWRTPSKGWAGWEFVRAVRLNPNNPKRLVAEPGEGVLWSGPWIDRKKPENLVTKAKYGDLEAHVEFLIPKGSNSGVKFGGVYEIQIIDSFGKAKLSGDDIGGIYPRAELKPKYHHIDEGYAPRTNASRPAGDWQTLDITFLAPRFDDTGKKVANARFVKVILNGQVVQQDMESPTPTGNNWVKKEAPTGPFLLQGDHGPIAFRNVRIRPLVDSAK